MTQPTPEGFADDARRYRLDSRIATGGMGEVWRATDTTLGRTVAVKLLKTEYADDREFRQRFETEARHAAALHHPNIASVYDFGEARAADGSGVPRPFLVMELVDGKPLSDLLRPGTPLDPDATRYLLAQAADALAAAHRAGIVHRDVKPANLLVTPDRQVKITDFGIARAAEGIGITQTGQVMGTPQYLSPEQARGEPTTPASDVYALGVVAFECLTGRRPFQAESPVATALAHLQQPVPELPAEVPADLARVVRRALAKEPAARYADGAAFAAALRNPAAAVDDAATQVVAAPAATPGATPGATQVLTGVAGVPGPRAEPAQDDRRRRAPWLAVVVLLLLAALVLVAALLLRGDGEEDPTDEATPPATSAPATPAPSPTTEDVEPTEPTEPATSEPTGPEPVFLDQGDYQGRPVQEVERELRELGFGVDLEELENDGSHENRTVESIDPSGEVEPGTTITVRYWGTAPAAPDLPDLDDDGEDPGGEGRGNGGDGGNGGNEGNGEPAEGGSTQ